MRISTKGRYGLRFLLDLATAVDGRAVTLKDVARRQGISEKYLWQVAAPLKAAGLVLATPGARGGFQLARPAESMTLRDLVDVLEGGHVLVDGSEGMSGFSPSSERVANEAWARVSAGLGASLEAIKLSDLASRHRALAEPGESSYSI